MAATSYGRVGGIKPIAEIFLEIPWACSRGDEEAKGSREREVENHLGRGCTRIEGGGVRQGDAPSKFRGLEAELPLLDFQSWFHRSPIWCHLQFQIVLMFELQDHLAWSIRLPLHLRNPAASCFCEDA